MINDRCLSSQVRQFFHPQVLSQSGILQTSHCYLAAAVSHLFLAHSAAELICLCHFYPEWCRVPGQSAFATIGLDANDVCLRHLANCFPNAKVHTVFGNDLAGRVWDCKISLWQNGLDADFRLACAQVRVKWAEREFFFPAEGFTLNRFFKRIGKFQTNPALKPRGGYRNFTEKFCACHPL